MADMHTGAGSDLAPIDWSHQPAAIDAAATVLDDNPRTTIVAACGAGKTRIGAGIAARFLGPDGSLLLILPTIDLLSQTLVEYAELLGAEALGTLIAVCSDQRAASYARAELGHDRIEAHVTTDPEVLARLVAAPGRKTVAATYASQNVLERAHARHGMGEWSFAIADEAHRTAGVPGKPWAAINDDVKIPSRRRLYLTATPRVFADDGAMVSMDDEKTYGPVAYTYSFARGIDSGVLVDYQLVVPVITDGELLALVTSELTDAPFWSAAGGAAVSPQILATQLALLRAAHETGAKRLVTFHHTINAARSFAATLKNAAELLPAEQQPVSLRARHISGHHNPQQRRLIFGELKSPDPGLVVLSNARVMSEGVNIPVIDGVAFIDPRGSFEGTIQAVGRALRSGGRRDKIATIVVPVLLGPTETPESALRGSAYSHVWRAIQALGAHDERLGTWVRETQQHSKTATARPGEDREVVPPWLKFVGVPVPTGFVDAMQLRIVRPRHSTWNERYAQAKAYAEEHGRLPTTDEQRELGQWVHAQRGRFKQGHLGPKERDLLDALGMTWDLDAAWWNEVMAALAAFAAEHGHLDVPNSVRYGTPPRRLSDAIHTIRKQHAAGRLPDERVTELTDLGIDFVGVIERKFQAGEKALREYYAAYGHLDVPAKTTWGEDEFPLGAWRQNLVKSIQAAKIRPARRDRLADLIPLLKPMAPTPEETWEGYYKALEAYHREHGHILVTATETFTFEGAEVGLGTWLRWQRKAHEDAVLEPERVARLEALGIVWDGDTLRWWRGFRAMTQYIEQHGALPPRDLAHWGDPPIRLNYWRKQTLKALSAEKLNADQAAAVASLGADFL